MRADGHAAGGKPLYGNDVKITVERAGKRLRNGRRRHKKEIRTGVFFLKGEPLGRPEFVLFVDDDHTEIFKNNPRLHERMRSDHEAQAAVCAIAD
jgi:hypothetical protein